MASLVPYCYSVDSDSGSDREDDTRKENDLNKDSNLTARAPPKTVHGLGPEGFSIPGPSRVGTRDAECEFQGGRRNSSLGVSYGLTSKEEEDEDSKNNGESNGGAGRQPTVHQVPAKHIGPQREKGCRENCGERRREMGVATPELFSNNLMPPTLRGPRLCDFRREGRNLWGPHLCGNRREGQNPLRSVSLRLTAKKEKENNSKPPKDEKDNYRKKVRDFGTKVTSWFLKQLPSSI